MAGRMVQPAAFRLHEDDVYCNGSSENKSLALDETTEIGFGRRSLEVYSRGKTSSCTGNWKKKKTRVTRVVPSSKTQKGYEDISGW